MDIFTTVLTRVVPVPIKQESLKVKALLKEAATSKLKEDHEHLENHDYYFVKKQADNEANQDDEADKESKHASKPVEQQVDTTDEVPAESDSADKSKPESISKDEVKHLDLYV